MTNKKSRVKNMDNSLINVGTHVMSKLSTNNELPKLKGVVTMYDQASNSVAVKFDKMDDEIVLKLRDVKSLDDSSDIVASSGVHTTQPGFNQYGIEWADENGEILDFTTKGRRSDPLMALSFRARAEKVNFYGSWRRTRCSEGQPAFVIDLYARWDNVPYTLPSISYLTHDPRVSRSIPEVDGFTGDEIHTKYNGMRELNGDICTAINRWLHFHLSGNVQTIEDLRCRAENPVLRVRSFSDLHAMINSLTNLYNMSKRSGGLRSATIECGEGPSVRIEADLTSQVMKGEVVKPISSPIDSPTEQIKTSKKHASYPSEETGDKSAEVQRLEEINSKKKSDRTPEEIKEAKRLRKQIRTLVNKS